MRRRAALAALVALVAEAGAASSVPLKVQGSTTVNPVVSEAAEILRRERGAKILVDTLGGSSGGIAALADGRADVAMVSRPIEGKDRSRFPGVRFRSVRIGLDAVAMVVSRDVWEGGVRSLGRDELRGIYEGRLRRWSEIGGPDRRIVFFNKEPGRGTWEVFADWLYGDAERAPLVSHQEVGSNEEARSKVASTPGALTQLSVAWADGQRVFALALEGEEGRRVAPTEANLGTGRYPLARGLYVVTDGEPSRVAAELITLLLSPRGDRLVRRHGYLPVPEEEAGRAP